MFTIFVYACGLITLVQSHNQYQQVPSYPFGTSYGSIYGNQPIVVQPLSSYSQQYTVQNPSANYQTLTQPPTITNQLQEVYLNKILSNPALQAFVDPSTKIYNQNGIEISDQIRPRGTPVVNNYFIVPSDYLKGNETVLVPKKKITRNGRSNNYNSQVPKQSLNNEQVKDTTQFNNKHLNSRPRVKNRQSVYTDGTITKQEYNDESVRNNNYKILQGNSFIDDGQNNIYDKQRNNVIKQDQIASKHHNSGSTTEDLNYRIGPEFNKIKSESHDRGRKVNKNHERYSNMRKTEKVKNIKLENSVGECDEMFDINDECCELDSRNIRNPINNVQNKDTTTKSSKQQNDFMKNWMNYIKTLMPDQTFESLDFSTLPYNFEHMYQMPSFNFGSQTSSPNKITKKRKQKEETTSKQEEPDISSKNHAAQSKKMTVELVPKFAEIESTIPKLEKLEKGNEIVETFSEIKMEIPSKVQPSRDRYIEEIVKNNADTEIDTKEERSVYEKDTIDYYPDFTKDAIYTTDEDDLYFFHNRHYYNTDDKELNQERRKYERQFEDTGFKRSERKRINDIPPFSKNNINDNTFSEETKFKTPPGLNEAGFQTRKIEMNDRGNDFYTYHVDEKSDSDKPLDFKPFGKSENNIETVFGHSKVVKYGQQRDANEKPKVNIEQENKNERYHNQFSKDGDATLVFSKSWN